MGSRIYSKQLEYFISNSFNKVDFFKVGIVFLPKNSFTTRIFETIGTHYMEHCIIPLGIIDKYFINAIAIGG